MRIYNFGAGPACLPEAVLEKIKADIPDWYDGMSVMEVSHRMPCFMELTQQIEQQLRSLLKVPDDFSVLFFQGGARGQFAAVPMNLLQGALRADYLVTGHWSKLAYEDAKAYCQPQLVTPLLEQWYGVPEESTWKANVQAPYFHYTDNETIHGIEFAHVPKVSTALLVSDMTSNILTRPIDFSRFAAVYASAQKNLGIAGITMVIVRTAQIGLAHPMTPSILNYERFAQTQSMFNTPSTFAWYVLGLVLDWTAEQGGCEFFKDECERKSYQIYKLIDQSRGFYVNPIDRRYRSRVNIPFRLQNEALEKEFVEEASKAGLKQLKGHKAIGGCRASIYNAMPQGGVDALAEFMFHFQQKHA